MTEISKTHNFQFARRSLEVLWVEIVKESMVETDPNIDKLINSKYVAIRYCLPTQLLGKYLNPNLNCLCLQKGDNSDNSCWDPRSFASKVIVPWVADNNFVLGSSADPYVGKPLRKPMLESNPSNVKGKEEWNLLYDILFEVESKNSEEFTKKKLLDTLRSIFQRLATFEFEYFIPERISLDQTLKLITNFLSEPSGGDRGLSVATALFSTFGDFFGIFNEIHRSVINASDQSTGSIGDIECLDRDGNLKLVIEVKERTITLTDVKDAIRKARKISLKELLINSPGTSVAEETQISELIARTWASGTNIYRISIEELIRVGLSLTGEEGRKEFLIQVGNQLDSYNTQPNNRKRWKEILEDI